MDSSQKIYNYNNYLVCTDNIFTVKQKNNNKTQILFHNNFNGQKKIIY